jgi:hypothetical protein
LGRGPIHTETTNQLFTLRRSIEGRERRGGVPCRGTPVELQEAAFYLARHDMAVLDHVRRGENDAQLHHL